MHDKLNILCVVFYLFFFKFLMFLSSKRSWLEVFFSNSVSIVELNNQGKWKQLLFPFLFKVFVEVKLINDINLTITNEQFIDISNINNVVQLPPLSISNREYPILDRYSIQFQFSRSVVSDSLWPHRL